MRVTTVQAARKPQGTCGRCGITIDKGDSYRWWKFRYGGRRIRCTKPTCAPKRSELTQNEVLGTAWDLADSDLPVMGEPDDFDEQVADAVNTIGEILDMIQEKMDNIEQGFGHTSVPAYEELEYQQSDIEDWQQTVEALASDDFMEDSEECSECGGDEDSHDEDDVDHAFQAEQEFDYETAHEALVQALSECPI